MYIYQTYLYNTYLYNKIIIHLFHCLHIIAQYIIRIILHYQTIYI